MYGHSVVTCDAGSTLAGALTQYERTDASGWTNKIALCNCPFLWKKVVPETRYALGHFANLARSNTKRRCPSRGSSERPTRVPSTLA